FSMPGTVREVIGEYAGNNDVHILVNNTGGPPGGRAIDAAPDEFAKAYTQHLICNQILVQASLEGMQRARYARIIIVISTSVKVPSRGLCVSNSVRGAVAHWAKTLASEVAPYGSSVHLLLAGPFDTGRMSDLVQKRTKESGKTEQEI